MKSPKVSGWLGLFLLLSSAVCLAPRVVVADGDAQPLKGCRGDACGQVTAIKSPKETRLTNNSDRPVQVVIHLCKGNPLKYQLKPKDWVSLQAFPICGGYEANFSDGKQANAKTDDGKVSPGRKGAGGSMKDCHGNACDQVTVFQDPHDIQFTNKSGRVLRITLKFCGIKPRIYYLKPNSVGPSIQTIKFCGGYEVDYADGGGPK
jgi:hypothetical protein